MGRDGLLLFAAAAAGLVAGLLALLAGREIWRLRRLGARLQHQLREHAQQAVELRGERDRALAASAAKMRFFAAASHDLRQPLHALALSASTLGVLARRSDADAVLRRVSEDIDRALDHGSGLIETLLDLSRLDADAEQPQRRRVDLAALADGVVLGFAPQAAQRGLLLALDVAADTHGRQADTDPDLLLRLLGNLVGNALKFTPAGGVTLRLSALPDGRLGLEVADTGIGIAPAEQARVFEAFYQSPGRPRGRQPGFAVGQGQGQGLGLGLAIVQQLAQLLDIGLWLHSVPGEGTRIRLALPAATAGTAPAGGATNAATSAAAAPCSACSGGPAAPHSHHAPDPSSGG